MMKSGVVRKRSGKPLPVNCSRTPGTEHGLVIATFDCLNCGAEGDLRSPTCYANVLQAFVEDVQIDSIVLADLNHRQYAGGLVQLLRQQAELIRAFERASVRPGFAAEEPRSKCKECPALPSRVFGPLTQALKRDPVAGVEGAALAAPQLVEAGAPTSHADCGACFGQTLETARHLAEMAVETRATLGQLAYNVSEGSS